MVTFILKILCHGHVQIKKGGTTSEQGRDSSPRQTLGGICDALNLYEKENVYMQMCVLGGRKLACVFDQILKRFNDPKKIVSYCCKGPINVGVQNAGSAFSNAFRDQAGIGLLI